MFLRLDVQPKLLTGAIRQVFMLYRLWYTAMSFRCFYERVALICRIKANRRLVIGSISDGFGLY
jgi:hypothetical protein